MSRALFNTNTTAITLENIYSWYHFFFLLLSLAFLLCILWLKKL